MNQISRGCSRDFIIDMPYEAADVVAVDIGLRQRSALIRKNKSDCVIDDKIIDFGLTPKDTRALLPGFATLQAVLTLANGKKWKAKKMTLRVEEVVIDEDER